MTSVLTQHLKGGANPGNDRNGTSKAHSRLAKGSAVMGSKMKPKWRNPVGRDGTASRRRFIDGR